MSHRKLLKAAAAAAAGGPFDPETDITWHSLFWAEGTDFSAEGYSDTDSVTTWPNETGEQDATQATASKYPTYDASNSLVNNQPAVVGDHASDCVATAAFDTAPDYTSGVSLVGIGAGENTGQFEFLLDGINDTDRNIIVKNEAVQRYAIFAGGGTFNGTTPSDTNAHLFVAFYDGSTGTDTLELDDAAEASGSAGSGQLTGLTIGSAYNQGTGVGWGGPIVFAGIYEGDVTSDGSWSDFKTWVTDHYGITLA